jgi:hypothetical protein
MTREQRKQFKRKWIIQPIAVIVIAIALACLADALGCYFAP